MFGLLKESGIVYPALALISISFSIVPPALWPSVALVIDEDELATAYGLMVSIDVSRQLYPNYFLQCSLQNASLVLMNLFVGVIIDHFDYRYVLVLFAILDVCSAFLATALTILDLRGDMALTKVANDDEKMINKPVLTWA